MSAGQQPHGGWQVTAEQWGQRLAEVMSGQAYGQAYDEQTARGIVTREMGPVPATSLNGQEQSPRMPLHTEEERFHPEYARDPGGPRAVDAKHILQYDTQPADIARTLARLSRGRLMWDPVFAEWFTWVGTHWRVSDPGWEDQHTEARRVRDTARKLAGCVRDGLDDSANCLIGDPGPEVLEKLTKAGMTVAEYKRGKVAEMLTEVVKRLSTKSMQRDILGQVASHQGILTRLDEMEGRKNVLNFTNKTVALDKDESWKHKPDNLVTHCLPYAWNPAAKCDDFRHLVWKMTGPDADEGQAHRELFEFVLNVLGYCVIYGNPAQLVFFLTGRTKTGKTTVIEIVAELLGALAHKSEPVLVTVPRQGNTHDSVTWSIRGRRLVYVDETKGEMRIDVAALKDLSGGRTYPVRPLYGKEYVPTRITWAIVVPTNHMPSMTDGDEAMGERLVKIDCVGETIPVEKRNRALAEEIIKEEAEGILALLVERARRYYSKGLPLPQAVAAASEQYMAEQDTVARFREERCTSQPLNGQNWAWVHRPDLFRAYEDFCGGRGHGLGRNDFYKAVRKLPGVGEDRDSRGADIFTGITLLWPSG